MNAAILNPDVQEFINQHLKTDPTMLILKGVPFDGVSAQEVVEQLEAKHKCEKKLPTWFQNSAIYYPNKLNIEQTSSELTAAYKAGLIEGDSLIDVTGGFGVDAHFFGKHFAKVTHCEWNADLSAIVSHNFNVLRNLNIEVVATDGWSFLKETNQKFDWIYIDPSRRHDSKGKVFFLKDCLPNIPEHLKFLWSSAKNIMIKTSPLLDLTVGLRELDHVKTIHVVAVNNDVKEVLWILEEGFSGAITIKTSNLKKQDSEYFEFCLEDEATWDAIYSEPLTYLFEPNSAILKSGGFNSLIGKFNLSKLHKHSHLYTSDTLIKFPGRAFKILQWLPYNKKLIKGLSIKKANITTRNFPETVQNLRHIFKIKDGGAQYLFFTTNHLNQKILLVCIKAE